MAGRLIQTLDMDEATFNEIYRRTSWPWPEPAEAAN